MNLFNIYGRFLFLLQKIKNLLPIVRKITCKKYKRLFNFTIEFYIIYYLITLKKYCIFLTKIIDLFIYPFNHYIDKTKIDFYINNNNYTIILTRAKSLIDIVNNFNKYINEYNKNKHKIVYDKYCCKISDIKISNNNIIIKELNLNFIKDVIGRIRGVDSEFNDFCNKDEYGISNKLTDVLDIYGYNKIDLIQVTKIPATKYTYYKEDIEKIELDKIDH
jgi:hypothetical protein